MCHKSEKIISILFCCALLNFLPETLSTEMFRTECQDRHFSLGVRSSYLGQVFRFDIEDSSGVHPLSSQNGAACGYTIVLDSQGDLVLRASYLACYVDIHNYVGNHSIYGAKSKCGRKKQVFADTEFQLLVWFVNKKDGDQEVSYPLLLTCPLQHPWSPREIVCEENYMEVSVNKQIIPESPKGLDGTTSPVEELTQGRVVFRVPDQSQVEVAAPIREETLPVSTAHLQGYHIKSMDTRILLRCAYSSPLSYTLQVRGVEVEAVSATIFYSHHWTLHMVDLSVACTINKAVMDGTHVLWTFPQILPPLVQTGFSAWGAGMGVEGRLLSDCLIQQRGYQIGLQGEIVEIRIPFGAKGGYIKSHVVNGQYSQSYSIGLLYVHQWEEGRWGLTQHRSIRPLWMAPIPRNPTVINNTVPSEGMFSVTLGVFPQDVSLYNVTVAGETVSWVKAEKLRLKLSHVPYSNNNHGYLLQAPFTHHLVSQKYIGGRHRRYRLAVTFTLLISPNGEVYNHTAVVECDRQDVVLPWMEGECTDRGVKVLVHYGNLDSQWEVYLSGHRLDWTLVQMGEYVLETRQEYYSLELPLYSLGMAYEDLTLHELVVSVHINLVDKEEAARVEATFVQQCSFPIRELLVCLPERRMVLVVDTSHITPPIKPRHTTLLDPSCGPIETDHTRALFSFSLDSCGTIRTLDENGFYVYVNKVRYNPTLDPLIHQHSNYSLPIGCRYTVNDNSSLASYHVYPAASLALEPHRRAVRSHRGRRQHIPFFRGGE